MLAGMVGHGAALRRPDAYTKLHLRCDGEGAAIRDETGQTITAVGGATQTATGARFATGKCIAFDGSGDYVQVGSKANLDFLHEVGEAGKWSIALWIAWDWDNGNSSPTLYDSNNDGSGRGINIFFRRTEKHLVLNIGTGSAQVVRTNTPNNSMPADSGWHFLAITFDMGLESANAKIYVDGSLVGSMTKTTEAGTGTADYQPTLGSCYDGSYPFAGKMDDIRFLSGICIDGTKVPTRRF